MVKVVTKGLKSPVFALDGFPNWSAKKKRNYLKRHIETLWALGPTEPVLRIKRPFTFFRLGLAKNVEKIFVLGHAQLFKRDTPCTLQRLATRRILATFWVGVYNHQGLKSCKDFCLEQYIRQMFERLPRGMFINISMELMSHLSFNWYDYYNYWAEKIGVEYFLTFHCKRVLITLLQLVLLDCLHLKKSSVFFCKHKGANKISLEYPINGWIRWLQNAEISHTEHEKVRKHYWYYWHHQKDLDEFYLKKTVC